MKNVAPSSHGSTIGPLSPSADYPLQRLPTGDEVLLGERTDCGLYDLTGATTGDVGYGPK